MQKAATKPKPATINLAEAKLRYASLPDKQRAAVYKALGALATVNGRRLTEYDTDLSKAQVDVRGLSRLDSLVSKFAKREAAKPRPELDKYNIQVTPEQDAQIKARAKEIASQGSFGSAPADLQKYTQKGVGPFKETVTVGVSGGADPQKALAQSVAFSEQAQKEDVQRMYGGTPGQEWRQITESIHKGVQDVITGWGSKTDPLSQAVGYLAGGLAATPTRLMEGASFVTDEKYQAFLNPLTGASTGDKIGAFTNIALDLNIVDPAILLRPLGAKAIKLAAVKFAKEVPGQSIKEAAVEIAKATDEQITVTLKDIQRAQATGATPLQIATERTGADQAQYVADNWRRVTEEMSRRFANAKDPKRLEAKAALDKSLEDGVPLPDVDRILRQEQAARTGQPVKADKPLSAAPIKGTQESTPTNTPLEPQKPVVGKPDAKKQGATGLANRVQAEEAELGTIIDEIQPTKGQGKEAWHESGKEDAIASGNAEAYADAIATRVAKGEEELTGRAVGALLEGKRVKLSKIGLLKEQVLADPKNKALKRKLTDAEEDLDSYLNSVQAGKGRWSDVGRALQAGTTINEGDFAEVLSSARRNAESVGEKVAKGTEKQLEERAARVKELDAQIAAKEAQLKSGRAKSTVEQTSKKKFDKETIRKERLDIFAEIDEILNRPMSGSVGAGVGGFDPRQLKNLADLAKPIGKLAINFAKEGAATIEDVVRLVQKSLKDRGIEVDDQFVIDAIATPAGKSRVVTDAEKEIARLKATAKGESTGGKMKIRKRIAELQKIAEEGTVPITKEQRKVSLELEDLRAQRTMWAGRVNSLVNAQRTPRKVRATKEILNAVRGIKLGSDIGTLTRQGLFLWSPKRIPIATRSTWRALKAAFSEKELARWAREIDQKKLANGRTGGAYRKQMGLSIADSITNHEEIVAATRIIRRVMSIPEWVLRKAGKHEAAKKADDIAEAIGGSLERIQTVFINNARVEMFDRAVKLGYDEAELKNMARFINNVTGRGSFKKVPTSLEAVFTSPRYEASRWNTIGEIFRQPARLGKSLVKGKVDKSALSAVGDLASTAGTVLMTMKAAELAGYEVEWNPLHADFLKMRRGDESWDPTAGIAPRIRDIVRAIVYTLNPDYNQTILDVGASSLGRALNPAVKTPVQAGSGSFQTRVLGKDESEIKDVFSSFEADETGIEAWLPLIITQYLNTAEVEGPAAGASSAFKEFLGQNVGRYPRPETKGLVERLYQSSSTGRSHF